MKVRTNLFPLVIIGIFFGIIGLGMLTGIWQTKIDAASVTVESSEDIKGWMTLEDVSRYLNLSVQEVQKILGLPSDVDLHKPIKDIAAENGKETDDYRELLGAFLGEKTASDSDESGNQSVQSVTIPSENTVQTPPQDKAASPSTTSEEKVVPSRDTPDPNPSGAETPKENGSGTEEEIKGRMTLKEVEVVTKVPPEYICQKLGLPADVSRDIPLRDLAGQYNFEVDDVRGIVAAYKK